MKTTEEMILKFYHIGENHIENMMYIPKNPEWTVEIIASLLVMMVLLGILLHIIDLSLEWSDEFAF